MTDDTQSGFKTSNFARKTLQSSKTIESSSLVSRQKNASKTDVANSQTLSNVNSASMIRTGTTPGSLVVYKEKSASGTSGNRDVQQPSSFTLEQRPQKKYEKVEFKRYCPGTCSL